MLKNFSRMSTPIQQYSVWDYLLQCYHHRRIYGPCSIQSGAFLCGNIYWLTAFRCCQRELSLRYDSGFLDLSLIIIRSKICSVPILYVEYFIVIRYSYFSLVLLSPFSIFLYCSQKSFLQLFTLNSQSFSKARDLQDYDWIN